MHAYAGVFTQTSSVKPNPFANVTIKIDVIFQLNACTNSVYQAFPSPVIEGLGTRLSWCEIQIGLCGAIVVLELADLHGTAKVFHVRYKPKGVRDYYMSLLVERSFAAFGGPCAPGYIVWWVNLGSIV